MNAHDDNDRNDLRYAEYALGILDADARAAVAREMTRSEAAAVAVALWQRRLAPLTSDIEPVSPPTRLWQRIRHVLQFDAPMQASRLPFWENLRLWHWIGIGASAIAVASITLMVTTPRREPHTVVGTTVMVSSIKQSNGVAGWTATMDLERKQIVVVPATPDATPQGHSTELWLIPEGQKPISVGVFTSNATTTLPLSPTLLSQLASTATLAVSIEPIGGSPTGQPTGPVIGQGAISGAPASRGHGNPTA